MPIQHGEWPWSDDRGGGHAGLNRGREAPGWSAVSGGGKETGTAVRLHRDRAAVPHLTRSEQVRCEGFEQ
jgi:hypothetical protein